MRKSKKLLFKEDIENKPMPILKRLYGIPRNARMTRSKLIEKLREKQLDPFNPGGNLLYREHLESLKMPQLLHLSHIAMRKGLTKKDIVDKLVAERT